MYSSAPRWDQAGCNARKGPQGDAGSSPKGPDAAGRPLGPIPAGEGWRTSPSSVRLESRSTRYAHLAFLAWLARHPSRGALQCMDRLPEEPA